MAKPTVPDDEPLVLTGTFGSRKFGSRKRNGVRSVPRSMTAPNNKAR